MFESHQPSSPKNFPCNLRVFLSAPSAEYEEEFLAAALCSQGLHQPWVFPPRTHEQYAFYLQKIARGNTIAFLLRRVADPQLAGVINVSEPVMGALRSAYLGFYAFFGFERKGYMTEGLALVLDQAFNELGFHRLEANIQPPNANSSALVSRLGFRKEGFSPRYLEIDGAWRDHDRWAILSDEWPGQRDRLFASWRANGRQS
jgi:[ribosomal protein S5]-alanine N-acetyltransferase